MIQSAHCCSLCLFIPQTPPNAPLPRKTSSTRRLALSALLALSTVNPVRAQKRNCLLPEAFTPHFEDALDDVSSILDTRVVQRLSDIGLGPIPSLNLNDFVNFKDDVFIPLFGDAAERNAWINATAVVDVKEQLKSNINNVIGLDPPDLSMTCELETTDDLETGEPPYRFAMEFVLSGSLLGSDLDLASMSPSIAVLPEDTYDPLSLTVETLSADYTLTLPLTLDAKRRKFMIGEIAITFGAALSTSVLQSIPLTQTVSQNFGGVLDLNFAFAFSSVSDWTYTADYEASLTAESSVGTEVAELALMASDDDMFDDKPREFSVL